MKTAEEVAIGILGWLNIYKVCQHIPEGRCSECKIKGIAQAVTVFAEERVAQRDLEQFGEAFMLNGKRIGPNEIYKSTADYVKQARAEALEEAAKVAEAEIEAWDKVENFERVKQCQIISECIRALKDKP